MTALLVAIVSSVVCSAAIGAVPCSAASASPRDFDPPDAVGKPVPVAEAPSVVSQFPGSSSVSVFPPRSVERSEVSYLVWISGADGQQAELVRQWAAAIAEFGPKWISDGFEELRGPASEFAQRRHSGPPSAEDVQALRAMFARRDQLAQAVFARESDYLRTFLAEGQELEPGLESASSRVMMARSGDAIAVGSGVSGHLVPQVLRLLYEASIDPRTSPEQAAAVRQYAIDNSPRVFEQRRMTIQAYLRLVCRSLEAHVKSAEAGVDPSAALFALYRPVALSIQRTAAINEELLNALGELVPIEVAADVRRAYRELAYDQLAADLFEYSAAASVALARLRGELREQGSALVRNDCEARQRALDELCRDFDTAMVHCFERGRQRDAGEGDRFLRKMLRIHDRALREAADALAQLRALAVHADADWDPAEFDKAMLQWRQDVQVRIDGLISTGALWSIVTPDQVAAVSPKRN